MTHRNYSPEECGGGDVGAGQFVDHAVAVRVGIGSEAFGGLDAVVVIEGVFREFAQRDDGFDLVKGADDEVGWIVGGRETKI